MFKRRVEESGKTTIFRFAFRIFFAHIVNVLITLIVYVLVENLQLIGIEPGKGLHPASKGKDGNEDTPAG